MDNGLLIHRDITACYGETIFCDVRCFDAVGSTNDLAKELADQKPCEGLVVLAERQTQGKGRLGKSWESPQNDGIYVSFVVTPAVLPVVATRITLLAAVAVCRAVWKGTGLAGRIKWPNDVVVNQKKICGILTELRTDGEVVRYAVCGIGVNVNQAGFVEPLQELATSLRIETGCCFDKNKLVVLILGEFAALYADFLACGGLDRVLDEYKSLCINMGRDVVVKTGSECITGVGVDIGSDGTLVILTKEGQYRNIVSGEASVRGLYGYV